MQKSHSWFFYLCAIEGAVAMAVLLSIPSEGGSFSPARLALIGFCLLLALFLFISITRLGLTPDPWLGIGIAWRTWCLVAQFLLEYKGL